jgi:hypothetical protein
MLLFVIEKLIMAKNKHISNQDLEKRRSFSLTTAILFDQQLEKIIVNLSFERISIKG